MWQHLQQGSSKRYSGSDTALPHVLFSGLQEAASAANA
jgi:hypothetical protein